MVEFIKPMKAKSVSKDDLEALWTNPDWVAEEKIDGSRYLLWINGKGTHLVSRRKSVDGGIIDKANNVPHITRSSIWKGFDGTVLDGEICGPDGFGSCVSIMGALPDKAQRYQKEHGWAVYKIFDILWFKGENIEHLPYTARKEYLYRYFNFRLTAIQIIEPIYDHKRKYYKDVIRKGGEGVILKDIHSIYQEGGHEGWVKVKKLTTYDGIVIGGQEGQGKYKGTLGALIIGQYRDGKLVEVATISGMTDEKRDEYWRRIKKGEKWVVEFEAQEQTEERYRHPRFTRDRTGDNKPLKECVWK